MLSAYPRTVENNCKCLLIQEQERDKEIRDIITVMERLDGILFLKFKSIVKRLRAAEKINYPILLVFWSGHGVAPIASYNQYETIGAPCGRTKIRRNFGIFIIFRDP